MRISAKGRYGLAAMVCLAQEEGKDEYITIISISKKLGISKIYLEQVFSLLKRANLVESTKGSSGGYRLSRQPDKITALDILEAVEQSLFEKNKPVLSDNSQNIEKAAEELVYDKIDDAIVKAASEISLYDLASKTDEYGNNNFMFYI